MSNFPYMTILKRAYDYILLQYNRGDMRAQEIMEDLKRTIEDLENNL